MIDNPISSVERSLPYPGSGAVKPLQQSEKDKDRAFADILDKTLEKDKEHGKEPEQDSGSPADGDQEKLGPDQWIPSEQPPTHAGKQPADDGTAPDGHLDVKA